MGRRIKKTSPREDDYGRIIWYNALEKREDKQLPIFLISARQSGEAVIILSNFSPSYRIPATVLGTKLLSEMSD